MDDHGTYQPIIDIAKIENNSHGELISANHHVSYSHRKKMSEHFAVGMSRIDVHV